MHEPMNEMVAAMKEMVETLRQFQAQNMANSAVIHCLLQTHPAPGAVLEDLLGRMDLLADVTRQGLSMEVQREALQRFVAHLSELQLPPG